MNHSQRRRTPRLRTAFVASVLALLAVGPGPSAGAATADDAPGRLLLMLDASGSMNGRDPGGTTKIVAAQRALTAVIGSLPANAQVGLRVYGATQPGGRPTPAACADTQLVHPITALDKPGLTTAVNAFTAKGETPIAASLTQALGDLGATGKRNIVLVSDGEESCVADPCPVIRQLVGAGIDLQIDTVGFGVGAKARTQLQCIADAGHGTYYDARDAAALTTSLNKLSQRALRPFTVTGTPVQGTRTQAGAPLLAPGQYTDQAGSAKVSSTFYRVERTMPDSTLRVTVDGRPSASAYMSSEQLRVSLTTPDDRQCGSEAGSSFETIGQRKILAARVVLVGRDPLSSETPDRCEAADDLVVEVEHRTSTATRIPFEIRVVEEPPVTDQAGLPDATSAAFDKLPPSPAQGPGRAVVGGSSFNDAVDIAPGTYVESVVPGELIFYKVRVDWGQRAVFSVDGPTPAFVFPDSRAPLYLSGDVFSPDRQPVDTQDFWKAEGFYQKGSRARVDRQVNVVPTVAYRNRFANDVDDFSLAGDYYVAIGIGASGLGKDLAGVPIPVRFSLAVTGTVAGAPVYDTPVVAPSLATSSTTTPDTTGSTAGSAANTTDGSAGSALPLVGGALVALALLGSLAWALVRRRANAGHRAS